MKQSEHFWKTLRTALNLPATLRVLEMPAELISKPTPFRTVSFLADTSAPGAFALRRFPERPLGADFVAIADDCRPFELRLGCLRRGSY